MLFEKLLASGINGKIFNLLKNIYSKEKCKIKIGKILTEAIHNQTGVRQGCILSPLLFNIFLADLPAGLDFPDNYAPLISEGENLSCILWTDDLVLLSEHEEGLNNMLSKLGRGICRNKRFKC